MYNVTQESERRVWRKNGRLHRDNFKPAIVFFGKDIYYLEAVRFMLNEEKDCLETVAVSYHDSSSAFSLVYNSYGNSPAKIYKNGTKEWYYMGNLHQENAPAVIYPNGDVEYWYFGYRHRNDGPAVIIGNKQYWFDSGNFIKIEIKDGSFKE